MNSYSTWPSIGQNQLSSSTFNITQPMQITTPMPNPNYAYQDIAKDFIEKYSVANNLGVGCVGHYYNTDALCSIHLHQGTTSQLFEVVGHANWMKKMNDLGITLIKYHTITSTSQPIGKNSVLITFHGQAEINGKNYTTISTFVVRITCGTTRIMNHVINIFF